MWGTLHWCPCRSGPGRCSLVQGTRHDPVDHGRLVEESVHMPMVGLLCIGDQGEVDPSLLLLGFTSRSTMFVHLAGMVSAILMACSLLSLLSVVTFIQKQEPVGCAALCFCPVSQCATYQAMHDHDYVLRVSHSYIGLVRVVIRM